jgi:porin
MLGDNLYIVGSLSDANGTTNKAGFDTFFNDKEYFKHLELGWVPTFKRRKHDNLHLTAWHTDKREDAGKPESWGVTFSTSWFFNETWLPFLRAGWSDGEAALLERMVSAGVGYHFKKRNDVVAIGMSWGRPSTRPSRDQYTAEIFYRFQLAQNLVITPDIQLIVNPANNLDEDLIWVFGIRGRLTF